MADYLTPGQVAHHAHCGRSSVMRALKSGELRGERDNRNRWKITREEADRWSGQRPDSDRQMSGHDRSDPAMNVDTTALETENKLLRERVEELRTDRDAWRRQAERLSEARSGIFGRIFRR